MTNGTTFPGKTFTAFWTAFWLLMISVSLQDALRNPAIHWWEPALWEGSSALVATGWILLAIRVRRRHARYLDNPLLWLLAYLRWLPVVIVTWIATAYAIRTGVYAMMGRHYQHPGWGFVVAYESVKLTIFTSLWLGVLFAVESHGQWQVQRHRLLQTQKALVEAQLAQLQGQLRPHFLFNALNTVSALMQHDVERADRLVTTLGDLLRISLSTHGNEMTPLKEELRTLALYADIMCERFRDRVTVSWHTDETLLDVAVPALLLQPLLENVFKHGVEGTATPVRVEVDARRAGNLLQISVSNSGNLAVNDQHDRLGLRNCRERLGIIYGAAASLVVRNEGDRVAARIAIPLMGTTP
ncbi:MAG: histidine kinase [Luteibacter sp.]